MSDPLVARMRPHATSVFAEFTQLAVTTGAINLGQGFPDTDGPAEIIDAAVEALRSGHNQYPPGAGVPELRRAIAAHQHRHYGIDLDPETEVLITVGATEAISASLLALLEPGDEYVTFEPYFDLYAAVGDLCGARRRTVALRPGPSGYTFDPDELRAAVTERTKVLLLNTPHNPTGKVFDHDELTQIADLCNDRDLVAVVDEVYEHLTYDGVAHVPLATLPGMSERTLSISSSGKTYSFTGWKIGWATGPARLVAATRAVKQHLTYSGGTPLQFAIATALGLPDRGVAQLRDDLQAKRDRMCDGLDAAGFEVFRPQATYFVTVDIRPLGESDGMAFCRSLPERVGVVAVPNVVFHDDEAIGRPLVRFAFCKRLEVIDEAMKRLAKM